MRISWDEVRSLEDFIQRLEDHTETEYWLEEHGVSNSWSYFADRPHFLMTMGFDEYVAFANHRQFKSMWFADDVEPDLPSAIYRRPSGQWFLHFTGPEDYDSPFNLHTKESFRAGDTPAETISLQDLFMRLYDVADKWTDASKTLWHPKLWTPSAQRNERITLQDSIGDILAVLQQEKMELMDLSWQQLEGIVAEVLRVHGLEIHLVKESPQGGRDVVARGELVPGEEPITMAVEVKHKSVVDRPELQTALWQNRNYPALMFITSGRFTSGVIEEKGLPENHLRLFLKDGIALGDLIRTSGTFPLKTAAD